MFEIYMVNGEPYEVSPDRLDDFLAKFPNATKMSKPEKTSGLGIVDSTATPEIFNIKPGVDSLEQQEIGAWENFKNNMYNTFEMVGDVGEFYFSEEGMGSSFDIATTLLYEAAFGKENLKNIKNNNFGNWFLKLGSAGHFEGSDTKEFMQSIKDFEEERKQRKKTMTFKEADSFADYLSVIAGSIANVGGSVVYNAGTFGTGFFMDFATDNFITANKEKAKASAVSLDDLLKSGDHDVAAPVSIAALQAGLELFGFSKIIGKTGVNKKLNRKVGEYLTKNYKKQKNIRVGLNILGTGRTEAFTEMGQTGLEIYNKDLAVAKGKGEEINDLMSIASGMFSPQGIEAGLQGFFGGAGLKGGAYSAKALNEIRKTDKSLDVENDLNELVNLRKIFNASKDEDVRFVLQGEIDKVETSIKRKIKKGNDAYNNLSDADIKRIEDLSDLSNAVASRANSLIEKFQDGKIEQNDFQVAIESLSKEYNSNKQSILETLYKENIEFAQQEGEKIGKKIVEIESPTLFQEKYDEIRTERDFEGDITNRDGFIKGNQIFINKQVAIQEGAISVGSHELLHGIIGNYIDNLSDKDRITLGKDFISYLNSKQKQAVLKRLKDNYQLEGDAIYSKEGVNEMFTALSDAAVKKQVTFDKTIGQKLKQTIQSLIQKIFPGNIDYKKEFSTGRQAYDFLAEYNENIKQGKLGKRALEFADRDKGVGIARGSMTAAETKQVKERVTEIGLTYNFEGGKNIWDEKGANQAIDEMKRDGTINNLIASKYKVRPVPAEFVDDVFTQLLPDIRGFNPEINDDFGGYLGERINFRAGDVYKKIYEKKGPKKTIAVEERTREGEVRVQVEADIDPTTLAFETEDLSIEGQAKKNKAKKQRYSKFRRDLGFDTESKIYNDVLSNVKKSLVMAYGATQNITDAQLRAKAIATKMKKEYANLNSPLFKQIKNFLTYGVADTYVKRGTKDIYISQLKKFRENIVENISTADLVQIEKKVAESDRIFTKFVATLTSKQQVQDAVNKEQLEPDALNKITRDKKTGKGAYSVNLYQKTMPTETELISWADQPGINPITGARQGLKGTRKDGIVMRMVNSLVTDAMMEAEQSTEVQSKIIDMGASPLSTAELGAAIGREVGVKFSKTKADVDILNAMNGIGDVNVYSQIKFSKSHRDQYEKQLTKRRPDLTEEQRKNAVQSVFDFVDGKNIPNNKKSKYEKLAMHYTANGYLILPEDGYKVIEAERIAAQKKLDPFSFKNPNVLIETYVDEVKAVRTNPDNVKTFTNKTEYTNGVVVYDVEDSKQGQLDTRKVIDTHFGKKANPWCLCARSGDYLYTEEADNNAEKDAIVKKEEAKGNVVDVYKADERYEIIVKSQPDKVNELKSAFKLWKNYNKKGNGHQIAFQNGKLISFRDGNQMQWWDRMDNPTAAPIVKGKKAKDGFRPVVQAQLKKPGVEPKILKYEKVVGNSKTGSVIVKNIDGVIISETNTKNGKLHGKQFELTEAPSIDISVTSIYENGDRLSDKETRVYKDKKEKVKNTFGKDAIHLDNITSYERTNTYKDYTSDLGKETIKIEGTVNQTHLPGSDFVKGLGKQLAGEITAPFERYSNLQGQKISLETTLDADAAKRLEDLQSGALQILKINGVEQDVNIRYFGENVHNGVKFSLTKLEVENKLDSYITKIIEDSKNGVNPIAEYFYSSMQLQLSNGVNVNDAYNTAYNSTEKTHGIGFIAIKDFENNVKSYYAADIREDGKKYATDYYKDQLKTVETSKNTVNIDELNTINDYLINIGRPIRSAMVDYITSNENLLEDVYKQFGEKYRGHYYLVKAKPRGYKVEFSEKKNGKKQPINLYQEVTAIKKKPSNYEQTIDNQAKLARKWLNKLLDSGMDKGKIKAILRLTSYGQRSPIRKLSKLGVYVETGIAKDLVLEHEITANDILAEITKLIDGKIDKEQLQDFLNKAYVHVLPKEIDALIKKYPGHTSNRNGQGYESMPLVENKIEELNAKGKLKGKTSLFKFSKTKKLQNTQKAINFSRSAKNPTRGITVLDFDDTLATSKSLIRFTRPDGTTGTLNAEQYASTYESLTELGYKFDFSEFTKVVEGKTAPLFNKALKLQSKFGPENMFILTARPAESAPAIFEFLKANGLNIPLKNITGLANSTAEAKANWIAGKVAEGYNDFYFADDALQNVKAVKNMLDQFDVKSKVQQAKIKFSNTMNDQFNDILEDVTGIEAIKRFSAIKARKRGASKGKFRFFIPPSHEDFVGLLYNFMGTGRQGDQHRSFFEQALVRPLNRAYREIDTAKQAIANDYKQLNKQFEDVKDKLNKKTPDGDFIFEDAIRVYLWNKHGYEIPGLSETDQANLVELVQSDPNLQDYAENLNVISKQDKYIDPGQGWEGGNIKTDLIDATGRVGRAEYFAEFNENADILFSEENLNKIEAGYGADFRSALEDILHRTKTGVNRPKGQTGTVNKLMNYLNGSVGAVMFFNTRSAILQQMSIVNYINFADNNIFAAAKAFANQKQYWKDFAFIFNSDMLKQRRGGIGTDVNGADLAQAVKGSKNPTKIVISKLLKLGFLPTQIGDNIAIATGGATYYRNRINKYIKDGLSQKEAEAKAFTDFQDLTQSTQQSSRPDMTSQQQASWIGKLVLNFQNITSQYNRIIKKAALDIGKGRISPPYTSKAQSNLGNLSKILYYGAIQNVIFYSLQTALFAVMFDEDEDEDQILKKRERVIQGSIDSILRGSGIYGAVASTLKNAVIKWNQQRDKKYNKDESAVLMELLNFSPVVGIKARKLVNAEKTINYNENVIREMETFDADNPQWSAVTNYTEALTNFPANRLYQKSINMRNALDKDYTMFQRIMFFSGYTTWSLGLGDNEAVIEAKEKIKINKANTKKRKKKKKKQATIINL